MAPVAVASPQTAAVPPTAVEQKPPKPPKVRKPSGPLGLFPIRAEWTIALNHGLTAPPAYDATRAYFPIESDQIVAYDLVSGKRLWIAPARTTIEPAAGGDLLFVVLPQTIAALRAGDGSVAWELPLAEPLAAPPVWDNGWLVAATAAGSLLAIRAADGSLLWRVDMGAAASARPVLGADRVYVPLSDGRVVALALEDGKSVWEHKLGGAATDLLPLEDRLFVGSKDNFFYCLRTRDGSPEWRWRTGADIIGVPVVDEHNVYFVSLDNVLRALHRSNGVQQWKRPLPLRPNTGPVKVGDSLIVSGPGMSLPGFSLKDGTPTGQIALPTEPAAPPHLFERAAPALPSLVVCTQDLATGATVRAVTRSIDPEATPIAPLPNPIVLPPQLPAPKPSS